MSQLNENENEWNALSNIINCFFFNIFLHVFDDTHYQSRIPRSQHQIMRINYDANIKYYRHYCKKCMYLIYTHLDHH